MSTVNVGSALPAGTNTIGNVKLIDTGGTNQAAIDANNNVHVAIYNAANSMGIDANNNAHVGLWNGTNQAAVDSNGNQAIKGNFTEQSSLSAGSLNADLVASTDVSAYKWWSLHVTGTFTGTLTFQGSNDNSNWTSVEGANLATTSSISTTLLAAGVQNLLYAGMVAFRYLRIRMTAYTSGTATGTLELYTFAPPAPIIGAIAAQSGTWTVQPGNTANTTAWKVDGSAVTQPVSGTVTANAGTNLNTSLIALETGGNLATLAGAVTSAKVQANVSQINGVAPTMGNGVTGTGVQRVTISSDSTGQVTLATGANTIGAVTQASGPWTSNITQIGGSTVTLGSKTSANSFPIVIASDQGSMPMTQSGTWTVQPGNTANTTPWLVTSQAGTAGGSTPYHKISAASTNATNVKASAGTVYGFEFSNTNSSARYVRFYNSSSAPTVGTTTIVKTVQVPGNTTVIRAYPVGLAFGTGISWSATGAMADAD